MYHVYVEKVITDLQRFQEAPPHHEPVRPHCRQCPGLKADLQIIPEVGRLYIETCPAARKSTNTVIVLEEIAERVVHTHQGAVPGERRVCPAVLVLQRFGARDIRIGERSGHPLQPIGAGQDVVAVHERDDLTRGNLDAPCLAGLPGPSRVIDHDASVSLRNLERIIRGAAVRHDDLHRAFILLPLDTLETSGEGPACVQGRDDDAYAWLITGHSLAQVPSSLLPGNSSRS